jgi:hypothetical protein
MNARIMLTTIACAAGLFLPGAMARGQTLNLVATADPRTGASGTYDVTITQLSPTQFAVSVVGANDGLVTKHNADQISFAFLGDTVAPGSAGGTSAPWVATGTGVDTCRFESPVPGDDVTNKGGVTFTGDVDLMNAFTSGLIKVAIQDGGQQWFVEANLVPEPAPMMLMFPAALITLLALRRKRRRSLVLDNLVM